MGRRLAVFILVLMIGACSRGRRYNVEGQIVAVDPSREEITLQHGDIKGFMPAMTMPFKVSDRRVLSERKPGDLIKATLVVGNNAGWLEDIVRTGEAPLPADAPKPVAAPLEPGAPVADAEFLDHAGRRRRLSEWQGKTLAVTFVYTRCPLPDFCPLMDKNFVTVQRSLASDASLGGRIELLSVSFDPDYDTPAVLREHARKVGAKDAGWTWLTGKRDSIDSFSGQFGVSIIRADRPLQEITHNLRTIVIDRSRRLVKIYSGNDWTPEQLLETLRDADAR